jgi:hypothetical protein|tara:strand:- start:1594 stop:1920 length:327 start_codon:yes stop_codon:yes gene_type:complete
MNLSKQNKSELKTKLITLMDEVNYHLKQEPDVDKFLDETTLFDEWEAALSQQEYPILVMAVLNNIRKNSILDSIIAAILGEGSSTAPITETRIKSIHERSHIGEHPFN